MPEHCKRAMRAAKAIETWIEERFRASDIMLNCGENMAYQLAEMIELETALSELLDLADTASLMRCECAAGLDTKCLSCRANFYREKDDD